MPVALIVIGAAACLYGAFSIDWTIGVIAVGLLLIAAGRDLAE